MTNNLLAGDFWVVFNFGDPNRRYQRFLDTGRPAFERLIESVLIHDQVVVPTQDYLSLTVLLGVLGETGVLALLESGALTFLRLRGALAYIAEHGLQPYTISSRKRQDLAFSAPAEEAVQWAIKGLDANLQRSDRIAHLTIAATKEVLVEEHASEVRQETYLDLHSSPLLRRTFSLKSEDLDALSGVNRDQVRIFGGPYAAEENDEVSALLKLAHANLELKAAHLAKCKDCSTSSPVGHLLKAKGQRVTSGHSPEESFATLVEIENMPDIPKLVLDDRLALERLVKLRSSRNGEQFRRWFHENCRSDPLTTAREYVALLKELPLVERPALKVLRFLTAEALSLLVPGLPGAIDSFVLDRIARGWSPKFFIHRLRQMARKADSKRAG